MEKLTPEVLFDKVKAEFNEYLLHTDVDSDFITITISSEKIYEVIHFLYHNPELQFKFLTSLFAVHYPATGQMGMVYLLHKLETNQRLRIRTFLSDAAPEIDSVTGVFSAVNWMERETFDFFGVKFKGHPDLRRILNVEDMIMFPMRKEFPLEDQVREDKDNKMFGR